jgi:ArsR family transcriptional regulator
MREEDITLIDVRPEGEYQAGHIPGALSIPIARLKRRLADIPRGREVVAYCRGPYCVYSVEAVSILRKHGYRARRAEEGLPDWQASGLPIAVGE